MIKTVPVHIGGKTYPASMTLRVLSKLEERTGKSAGEALDALTEDMNISDMAWLLVELLAAGHKIAAENGENAPEPPDLDTLMDFYGLEDVHRLTAGIIAATETSIADVEAISKNAEATAGAT